MLVDDFFIPQRLKDATPAEKYEYVRFMYLNGHKYVIQNNISVFAPFPGKHKVGDITDLEKLVIYNPELSNLNKWIMSRIVINLGRLDYRTRGVLVRIATGMLNKIDIPKRYAVILHTNMCDNIESESTNCVLSELPF